MWIGDTIHSSDVATLVVIGAYFLEDIFILN